MAKGYWLECYRAVGNPAVMPDYAERAGATVRAGGGRFLARGGRMEAHEAGFAERTVIVEFPSFEQAVATHDGEAYRAAAALLEGAVERDFRIVEGVD